METPDLFGDSTTKRIIALIGDLARLGVGERVRALNEIRLALHNVSPMKDEPVDCVIWVEAERVAANDYNPNAVAPPEMELLRTSISEDGYTQPIVAWSRGEGFEVVDGFHRNRVGRECDEVRDRIHGYLPLAVIKASKEGRGNRIASTIRHNRARGKHKVEAMSDIVIELKRRNWTDSRISRELGMDQDEILRLCQITGLSEVFGDSEFSRAWDVEGEITDADYDELMAETSAYAEGSEDIRTVNTSDPQRVFHTWDKWECYPAGFYANSLPGVKKADAEERYREFLADDDGFRDALAGVTSEWVNSCEHYLTNAAMNRIAWLGQASACYAKGLPAVYRGGFWLLTEEEQARANNTALEALNAWLVANDREPVTMDVAQSGNRQAEIY